MIHEPPIDKLVEKVGCKFALTCLVAKRARQIIEQPTPEYANSKEKPLTLAAKEVYDEKLTYTKD